MKKEFELIKYVRTSIITCIEGLTTKQLNLVPDKMKNNLIWNMGHMIFTQQGLCYSLGGLTPTIDQEFYKAFAPGTAPEREFDDSEIAVIKEVFISSLERLIHDEEEGIFESYRPWSLPSGITINSVRDAVLTNCVHEGRHFGVVISLAKMVS